MFCVIVGDSIVLFVTFPPTIFFSPTCFISIFFCLMQISSIYNTQENEKHCVERPLTHISLSLYERVPYGEHA